MSSQYFPRLKVALDGVVDEIDRVTRHVDRARGATAR